MSDTGGRLPEEGSVLLEVEREGDGELRLRGEIDVATARKLEHALSKEVERGRGDLRLELDELAFVDSTGIQVLVQTAQRLNEVGRRMILEAPRDAVHRVLELVGFGLIANVQIVPAGGKRGGGVPDLPGPSLEPPQGPNVHS